MKLGAVVGKELRGYFNSAVAWVVLVLFLLWNSIWFFVVQDFFAADVASLRAYFGTMPLVFVVLVPAITMRMWAEEHASGTDETLLTLPLRESDLVLGKYLAGLILVALALALTLFVPWTVAPLGDFERGEIIGQYLGLFFLGSAAVAIGQFFSSLARNQISAFLFTSVVLLGLSLLSRVGTVLDPPDWLASFLNYLSLDYHYRSFNRGVLDTRDVAFFVGVTGLFLHGTIRAITMRKYT